VVQELASPSHLEQSLGRSMTPRQLGGLQLEERSSYFAYPRSIPETPAFFEHGIPHRGHPQALIFGASAQLTEVGFGGSLAENCSMSMMPGPSSHGIAPSPFASPIGSKVRSFGARGEISLSC